MKVMKFGGASLADASKIKQVSKIISDYCAKERLIVVVSAVQGVTDKLISIVNHYRAGNVEEAVNVITGLYNLHLNILNNLDLPSKKQNEGHSQINNLFGNLFSLLFLPDNNKIGWYDKFLSFGEVLSSRLVTLDLVKNKIKARHVDSSELIITDNNFGAASPLMDRTVESVEKVLYPLIVEDIVPVVTGFFGGTAKGEISLLGRGGSDYSATILAFALEAQEVILWKEVNGIYDSDPKISAKAKFFPEISYDNAAKLATNGAKILHPQALKPVAAKEITVWIKNTFNPAFAGSKIWKGKNGNEE